MKVYLYRGCSTCKKALKFLKHHNISFDEIAIVNQPPSISELKAALETYKLKALFNTSGEMYRSLGMKDKLPEMSEEEALKLLSENGKLIKRPFVAGQPSLVGFKEEQWNQLLEG